MQGKLVDARRNNDGLVRETVVAIHDHRDTEENSRAAALLAEVHRGRLEALPGGDTHCHQHGVPPMGNKPRAAPPRLANMGRGGGYPCRSSGGATVLAAAQLRSDANLREVELGSCRSRRGRLSKRWSLTSAQPPMPSWRW